MELDHERIFSCRWLRVYVNGVWVCPHDGTPPKSIRKRICMHRKNYMKPCIRTKCDLYVHESNYDTGPRKMSSHDRED